jgi:hypothetical protein
MMTRRKKVEKTIFEVREYNNTTKTYQYKETITAYTADEAKEIFIKKNKWKSKKDITLFVRLPNCK